MATSDWPMVSVSTGAARLGSLAPALSETHTLPLTQQKSHFMPETPKGINGRHFAGKRENRRTEYDFNFGDSPARTVCVYNRGRGYVPVAYNWKWRQWRRPARGNSSTDIDAY